MDKKEDAPSAATCARPALTGVSARRAVEVGAEGRGTGAVAVVVLEEEEEEEEEW